MPRIVVVGAGPVGLYTAIRLSHLGHQVQVIDSYIDRFVRPGVVAINAGATISRNLSDRGIKLEFTTSSSLPDTYNIRDLQKGLFKKAKECGVSFQSSNFERIEKENIVLEDSSKLTGCNLLIDCSGEGREVIEHINTLFPNTFKITQIANNPIKSHFIAFINMDKNDANLVSSAKGFSSELDKIKVLKSLQLQGWKHEGYPAWDTRRWDKGESTRMSCYLEVSDDVASSGSKERQQAWLSSMLELKAGKKNYFRSGGRSFKIQRLQSRST